jgi:peptidoglycan/xylan/chitin deacetylase (PgdA/CDA1 family)
MYHKVAERNFTEWWVSQAAFARQMAALAGRRIVHLDDYDSAEPSHVALTFDDAYECVYRYAFPVLKSFGYPFEVFAIGDYAGKPNSFDPVEPPAPCCTLDQLAEMAQNGARIQWHTRSHPHLPLCSPEQQSRELDVPEPWRKRFPSPHLCWFAYPYGEWGPISVSLARQRFRGALSVYSGIAGDRHTIMRTTVVEETELRMGSSSAAANI